MQNLFDVIVVGGGPAGLTAALYLARARYRVLVVEKEKFGGQITITSEVVNYPGVKKTSGAELTRTMREQAEAFGAEFLLSEVKALDLAGELKSVLTEKGEFKSFGILLATGAHPRQVGFKGEGEFRGHGVAYCATCDGEFFTGKQVFVVGGGFAAAEEAVFLTKYASHVTILIRGDDFKCAKATADEARNNPKITVLTHTEVEEVSGGETLSRIVYKNNQTGKAETLTTEEGGFGVFVFAGYAPETKLVEGLVELDRGYIVTDRNQKTSVEGVYAAGDVCIKNLRQVVTAVGDGATAATELEKYAAQMQKKTGLKPEFKVKQSGAKTEAKPEAKAGSSELFDEAIKAQLDAVFSRMQAGLVLRLGLDSRPVSAELKAYIESMAALTSKLKVDLEPNAEGELPYVKVCSEAGAETGLAFHGVPGGHEFTSFVLGLYNAAGPGQPIDGALLDRIKAIKEPTKIEVMVSLTCTMCPELVTAAQRIASLNPNVSAEVFDLNHFPDRKEKFHVMSVPCFTINGGKPRFGKKGIVELLDLLGA